MSTTSFAGYTAASKLAAGTDFVILVLMVFTISFWHREYKRPTLHDVKLVGMSIRPCVLSGFERINDVEYMQSWYCQPCD